MEFHDPARVNALALAIRERRSSGESNNDNAYPAILKAFAAACGSNHELIGACGKLLSAILCEGVQNCPDAFITSAAEHWKTPGHGTAYGRWLADQTTGYGWQLAKRLDAAVRAALLIETVNRAGEPPPDWWNLLEIVPPAAHAAAVAACLDKITAELQALQIETRLRKVNEHLGNLSANSEGIGRDPLVATSLLALRLELLRYVHTFERKFLALQALSPMEQLLD